MPPKNQHWWLTADEVELEIEADAGLLYDLVSDLPRIGEWSPECERVEWQGGATGPVVGATFIGHNRGGPGKRMNWSRHGRVVAAEPGKEFAFATEEVAERGCDRAGDGARAGRDRPVAGRAGVVAVP